MLSGNGFLEVFGISPALFVQNEGQWPDESLRFVHQGSGATVAMTDTGPLFQVTRWEPTDNQNDGGETEDGLPPHDFDPDQYEVAALTFSASFVGANEVTPVGLAQSETVFNYFVGEDSTWRSDVAAYEIVAYEGLYDGIALHTWGLGSSLKYEFHVAPGADWSQIQVRYDGIAGLSLAQDGSLLVNLGDGWDSLIDAAPHIYQESNGQERVAVPGEFVLLDDWTYTFNITGTFDPARALVIDPDLAWATYLGGSGDDIGEDIAVDAAGNALVTGWTTSTNFSGQNNGYKGNRDAFVAKVSPTGQTLWATYLGGTSDDYGHGIALDASGNALVTGTTSSTNFSGQNNGYKGGADAFVAKVSPTGQALWATYLGGTSYDYSYGIALDAAGNALVTGTTSSANFSGQNNGNKGNTDAFVAKVSPTGQTLWATYLGGSSGDYGDGIALDASGNALVTGTTSSANFSGQNNGNKGNTDAFVAKVSPTGQTLWATYLGGSSDEYGDGIALDASGNALVTGTTSSANFSGQNNGNKGNTDAFVAKVSPAGETLWATYLGGSSGDYGDGIALDASGNALVTGYTTSTNFSGTSNVFKGGADAFIAKVSPTGQALWATYLGGSSGDEGRGIALDASGNALVTGYTRSTNFSGTNNAPKGYGDAFIAKVFTNTPPIADAGGPYEIVEGDSLTVDASASYDPDDDALSLLWDISGDGSFNDAAGVTVALSWAQLVGLGIDDGGTYTLTVRVDDGRGGVSYATQTLTVLNTPPTLTISGPALVNEGSVYTLNLSSSDPGNDTITQWIIDWGDGTVETTPGNPSSVIHVYADGTRNHTIRASATDEDGTWDAPPVGSNAMVSLDPTFGDGGRVTADFFDSTSDLVQDAALVQPDGKIVLAGYKSAGVMDLVLARYTAAGLLDETFGTNGVVITDFGITEYPYALTQDAEGRLLVGGNFGLLRFEAAGALDATFGSNGRITNFGTTIQSIALDSQGRIVVGGGNRVARFNADGILDGSFNENGLRTNLTVPGTSTYFGVTSLTIDGQDRIILGGSASLFNDEANRITNDFVVVRLDEHGAVDATFADGGKYVADFGGPGYWSHDYVRDLAIDSQGRIIAAGTTNRYNPDSTPPNQYLGERAALVRIDADGVADESFNTNARAAVEPWSGWDARGVAIDLDDKLLFTNNSGVVRLKADGTVDTTFGSGGRTTNSHGVWNSQTILLAEQGGSYDILRTGYRSGPGIEGANLGVVRYGYSGNLDTSFAGGVGYISTDFQGSTADYVRAITVTQPDGKVVIAGYKSGGTTELVLARYLADGTADPTFAGDGILLSGRSGQPTALAIDASGGLVVALYNLVYRYQSDGTEDLGFGLSGQNYANTSLNSIASLLIDAQGGILAGGYTWRQHPGSGEYGYEFGITRLSGAGQLDTMFGVNGTAVVDFGGTVGVRNENFLQAMTFDENGRIVAAGYAARYNAVIGQWVVNQRHALARFSSDGSVDTAFGTNGTVLTDFGTGHYSASSVAIDSDGRILAGGNSHLARYLADGTLDSSFGTAGTGKVSTTGSFRAIVVDANHRIILGGSNNLLRYTTSGTPDTDFAPNGRFVVADSSIHTVILDASDRILIAGNTLSTGPTGADFLVARYLTMGLAVTVLNVAPQNLTISGPSTTLEGSTIQLAGSATDPGIDDQLSFTWTITRDGNAYAEAAGETISFVAHDGGEYVVTMRVNDGDGGVSTSNHTIIVANVAPTATFNFPDELDEGNQFTVSLTDPYDPSSVDTAAGFSYAFNFGLGFGAYSFSNTASFTPPDSGDLVVSARIRDKDGGVTEYTTTVAVENVAPIATLWDDGPVTYGELVTVGFSDPSDPSPVDTAAGFHYSFGLELADLAETYSAAGPSPSSSIGLAAGTHILYGRIFDKDDGYSDYTTTVVVAKAQLTVTADDWAKVYDGSPFESFTVSYSGFVAGDDHEVLDGELALGGPAVEAIDAGTYAITADGYSSTNYDITFETGTLTIDKADATISVTGYSGGVYDGTAHTRTVAVTGVISDGRLYTTSLTGTNAGGYNLPWSYSNGNYHDVSGTLEFVIAKADATIAVSGTTVTYDGNAHGASGSAVGVNGESLSGLDLGASFTNVPGGTAHWVFTDATGNYHDASGSVAIVIDKADQYLTWDLPVSILYGTALSEEQLNASVQVVGPAQPGALNYDPELGTILEVGVHTLTVTAPATENYNEASLSVELKVLKPYSISGIVFVDFNNDGEVNFGEMGVAEVLITLTGTDDLGQEIDQDIWTDEDGFYKFENLRPGSYHVTEAQPEGYLQGFNSEGTLGGQLSAVDQFFLQLGAAVLDASVTTDAMDYNFGERPPAEGGVEAGQTASIGFWQNKNGQALIQSLNGGAHATQLGDWLAATLPNMFGALEGKSNTQVGQHFRMLFAIRGQKLEAQVMATALAVYTTNKSLAGTAGQAYGFTVTEYGVGNRTYDVGTNGAAFGVENHTVMTVLDLLLATDGMTVGGILYCNEDAGLMKLLRNMANEVYDDINN